MFNLETINLFAQARERKEDRDLKEKEKIQSELKKYECFNQLFNNKEDLFEKCKNMILQDILTSTRSNTKINRDYLLGYQDAIDVFLKNLDKYKVAMEKLK